MKKQGFKLLSLMIMLSMVSMVGAMGLEPPVMMEMVDPPTSGFHADGWLCDVFGIGCDTTPPSVTIDSPVDGSTVSNTVTVTATATDDTSVSRVEFSVDGAVVATDTSAPYSFNWDTTAYTDGVHSVKAEAFDPDGNAGSDINSYTVDNAPVPDTTNPTVTIDSPTDGATVSAITTVTASASDNVGVDRVEFSVDGGLVATDTTAPYSFDWDTTAYADGSHTITATAFDAAGNSAADTNSYTVDNAPVPDTTNPTVTIDSPTNGATVSATTTVTASASDNVGVDRVEFSVDGGLVATDTTAPYSFDWDTTAYADGSHTVTATAFDAAGNSAADTNSYTVDNSVPSTQKIPWGITRTNSHTAQQQVDETGTIVAIVDTGFDLDHEDLGGLFTWGYSYYEQGAAGFFIWPAPITEAECTIANPGPCNDDEGHGTHVAGTIAAQDNLLGVLGVAPDVSLYIMKGLDSTGSGSYEAIAGSIRKAVEGPDGIPGTADDADVISMSLSGPSDQADLKAAVDYAEQYGVIIVAATGNDYAATASYPAAYPSVIGVGAVDQNDNIADFSNRGEDIFAPGVGVLSTYNNGGYATASGTSMATPHMAGITALAIAAHPSYTAQQIRNLVLSSVDAKNIIDASMVV